MYAPDRATTLLGHDQSALTARYLFSYEMRRIAIDIVTAMIGRHGFLPCRGVGRAKPVPFVPRIVHGAYE